MFRNHKRIGIILCLCIVLVSMTSCIMEISPGGHGGHGGTGINRVLLGKWSSEIEYSSSDALYDYASRTLLTVSSDGTLIIAKEYFLKTRTSETWSKDLSRTPSSNKYVLYDYKYNELEGHVSICDNSTLETLLSLDYAVLEEGRVLKLTDIYAKPQTSVKYTKAE